MTSRLSWPRRIGLLVATVLGLAALALLAASLHDAGALARMLVAANGSLPRGVAIVAALGVAGWGLGARVLRHRFPRTGIAFNALALATVLVAFAALWQWQHGLVRREIAFESAGALLQGTLLLPPGQGPHPAVVVVHGSPRLARDFYAVWGVPLARRGLAVFVYDKRGTGASGGTVPDDNGTPEYLRQLGDDAARAVAAVAADKAVDPRRVGLLGLSQGGWTVPVAARREPRAWRFALLSGPVASVGEENAFSAVAEGRNGTRAEDAAAVAAGEAAAARVRDGGFDPRPILAALPQPGLWIFGGRDRSIPVRLSVRRIERLAAEGHRYRAEVFADADHALFDRRGRVPQFDARLFDRLQAWFAAPVEAKKPVSPLRPGEG
jgi:dienelactone hydrolase